MEKMKLEIDNDIVSKIIVNELKNDYIAQQNQIRRLKECPGPLKQYQYEDMFDAMDLSEALETLLKYYIYRPDAEKWIREHSLRKRD
jgi:hypothetical protein